MTGSARSAIEGRAAGRTARTAPGAGVRGSQVSRARRVREAVRAQVADGLARGVFPGAVAAVLRGREKLVLEPFGWGQVRPRRRPMTTDTVFDLASLTKPLATATAVLQLREERLLDLDAPVASYLPAFAAGKAAVTMRQLLAHTSGLPAWEMLYLPGPPGEGATRAPACRCIEEGVARICATPVLAAPGTKVEYSDLGFIVLGHLVERVSGLHLDAFARRRVFAPLGLRSMRFAPPRSWRSRCAATEVGNAYERARAAGQGLGTRFRWRTHLFRGEVHDGNAWHLGRGVAGHAGLFGTAPDVARLAAALLHGGTVDGVRVLPASAVLEATRDQTPGLSPGRRGLGWALSGWPFAGNRASPAAFGHTGFTGTSLLVDPERDLVIVLLTNRVHPSADNNAILEFRPAFHDAVIEAVDG